MFSISATNIPYPLWDFHRILQIFSKLSLHIQNHIAQNNNHAKFQFEAQRASPQCEHSVPVSLPDSFCPVSFLP